MRPLRCLRGSRAEHARPPPGGRDGGLGQRHRTRRARRGGRVTVAMVNCAGAPPPTGTAQSAAPPPAAKGLRPIGPRCRPRLHSRRCQSAAATAALEQGGARCAHRKGSGGRGVAVGIGSAFAMAEALPLLVRSPTQRHPDLRLRGDPGWTVRRLKSELRRLVPDAPVSASPRSPHFLSPRAPSRSRWGGGRDTSRRDSGGSCRGAPGAAADSPCRVLLTPAPRGVPHPIASAARCWRGARSGSAGVILGLGLFSVWSAVKY